MRRAKPSGKREPGLWPVHVLVQLVPEVEITNAYRAWGINGKMWKRILEEGLSDDQADRLAIRTGHHPYSVWPEMLEAHIERYAGAG